MRFVALLILLVLAGCASCPYDLETRNKMAERNIEDLRDLRNPRTNAQALAF
jgi:starvation-inducible outer membrane lipoprotein